jgi:hypothetical protein
MLRQALIASSLATLYLACVPWVSDVSRLHHPIADPSEFFDASGTVLVLPVWDEANGDCSIRGPLVLQTTSLATLQDAPKSRRMLGTMGFDGHGPAHYRGIQGFIVIGAQGQVAWAHQLNASLAGFLDQEMLQQLSDEIRKGHEIRALDRLRGRDMTNPGDSFPGLLCVVDPIGFVAKKGERRAAVQFLETATLPAQQGP